MHTLLGELGYNLKPIPICEDNQGLIFISSNPITEKRSKHIDIRYHYIHEVIARKLAEVYFIYGDNNPADLLTKNLGIIKFQKFSVRKLDLSQLCFSLNFYFLMLLSRFPSMFPLLTYFQSFFSLSADYLRHSRRRRSKIRFY